jgi:hypothetical protein
MRGESETCAPHRGRRIRLAARARGNPQRPCAPVPRPTRKAGASEAKSQVGEGAVSCPQRTAGFVRGQTASASPFPDSSLIPRGRPRETVRTGGLRSNGTGFLTHEPLAIGRMPPHRGRRRRGRASTSRVDATRPLKGTAAGTHAQWIRKPTRRGGDLIPR